MVLAKIVGIWTVLRLDEPNMQAAKQTGRIPGLDGLRAIAIVMVLACHLSGTLTWQAGGWLRTWIEAGIEGVTVFFFLSGYLITRLLLNEEQAQGKFSLPDFYLRRAVRILPASIAFLVSLGIVAAIVKWPISVAELLACIFFARNFTDGSDHTGHYWTLASEEQFYLFWPILLRCIPRRFRIPVIAVLASGPVIVRLVLFMVGDPGWFNWWRIFRANALLFGTLLALLKEQRVIRLPRPAWIMGAAVALFFGALSVPPGSSNVLRLGAYLAELLAIGTALSVVVEGHCPRVQALMSARPMVYLGHLSYSLYLWQQPFCLRITGAAHEQMPWNVLWAFSAAVLSYHAIEQPCLRQRGRIREWLGSFAKRGIA